MCRGNFGRETRKVVNKEKRRDEDDDNDCDCSGQEGRFQFFSIYLIRENSISQKAACFSAVP